MINSPAITATEFENLTEGFTRVSTVNIDGAEGLIFFAKEDRVLVFVEDIDDPEAVPFKLSLHKGVEDVDRFITDMLG